MATRDKTLVLFDVDGTLTAARSVIKKEFEKFLIEKVKPLAHIGLVGGSDFNKIAEQMNGDDVIHKYDYVFPENGVIAYKYGVELENQSVQKFLGEEKLQKFINFVLKYLSDVWLPCKRGTFVEFRTGMLNISPIGRSCSRQERNDFEIYDREHLVRQKMIDALQKEFPDYGLKYSIGGQISFDVFPIGWDKTYCLKHVTSDSKFDKIYFFGDKTDFGGNDFEIFNDSRVIGHKVINPDDTKVKLEKLFLL
ncbi:phosphomannomutase [Chrysoperla carnea]|uniref:phosphomannomutase n=1 Tax=Chrysoperla carnea TaxID=189513 RepID=UPI001D0781A6|nr:phosphomannomutase [Chrysoperla carnea]